MLQVQAGKRRETDRIREKEERFCAKKDAISLGDPSEY